MVRVECVDTSGGNTMNTKVPVLPKDAYLSKEWFDKEQELIFSKTWQFAGFAEDVSEHGSYTALQVGKHPIVVINNNGKLNAFHNVCRHRGTPLSFRQRNAYGLYDMSLSSLVIRS